MQYLVTMTHGPGMCSFTDDQRRERAQQAAAQAEEIAAEEGVTILSGFTNPVAHRAWLHVEADDPAQVEQVLIATGMFLQNRCVIQPVRSLKETAQLLAED